MKSLTLVRKGYRYSQDTSSYYLIFLFFISFSINCVSAANLKPSNQTIKIGNKNASSGYNVIEKPYFYSILDAAGYSDLTYYGNSPIHPNPYHELLSGEWAAAIYYDGIDTVLNAMWLTDQFDFPSHSTNSKFYYNSSNPPQAWEDPNSNPSPLVDTGQSIIYNNEIEVQIDYEVVDLAFGDPDNTSRSPLAYYVQDGSSSLYMPSDRYIFLQTYSITNKDPNDQTLTNIEFYQMLHSHGADQYGPVVNSTYDSIAYDDPLENYTPYNPVHTVGDFRYDITQWNSTPVSHIDWVGFSCTVEPNVIENGTYRTTEVNSQGTHKNIENRDLNGVTEIYNDEVAGAMGWALGSLDPNETVSITIAYMWGRGEPVKESLILNKHDDIGDASCGVDPSDPNNNEITYTIYCSNPPVGDPNYIGTVNDVVITDYLPDDIDPCDVTVTGGGIFDMFANTVTWDVGTLEPGDANSFTVTIKIIDGEPASKVVNTAILTSDVGWIKAVETTDICCYGGSIIYVDDTAPGSNTGLNWNDAYNDLQAALARASECTTTEIWVASGIYMPDAINGDRNTSFELVDDIEIYGGFNGTETSRSERDFLKNKTVLSGDIDPDGNSDTDKIVHADSTITSSAILDGFIITDGDDGIYCDSGNPTIKNCVIADNHDDGVYCTGSNTNITWSIIKENGGDGIECYGSGKNLTVNNIIIYSNGENGIYAFYSTATIKNSMIFYNGEDGTVYYGVKLQNPSDNPVIRNCTIADNANVGVYQHAGTYADISNCIIWGNGNESIESQLSWDYTTPDGLVKYSCIQDSNDVTPQPPYHNINTNPYFAYTDPNLSDYHLHPDSPCVDAGDPCGTYDGEKDIDGDDRVLNGVDYGPDNARVDMGVDEVACDDIYNSLDWNIDAIVDMLDLRELAVAWLIDETDPCWAANYDKYDLNADDVIHYGDFAAFGIEWLWQPCWSSSGTGVWMMMEMMSMMTCGASVPTAFEPVATMSLEANDAYVVDEVANQLLETQRQFKMDQFTKSRNQKAYYESPTPSEPSASEQIEQIKEILDWLYEVKDTMDEKTWLNLVTRLEELLKELENSQKN